ncbi:MAG: serine acetyltransferase [Thermoguttaceae bacterium]|nr:serine acetyltransferase [Thermoguttaceae bacterium]
MSELQAPESVPDYLARLPEVADKIVESYNVTNTTSRLDRCPLPNKDAIIKALRDVNEILFPGYRRNDRLHSSNIQYYVGNLVGEIFEALSVQIARTLCDDPAASDSLAVSRSQERGEEIAFEFLRRLPELRVKLTMDAEAAIKGDPACKSTDEVVFCYPGFDAIVVYRVARVLWELGVPLIPRIMTEIAHSRTGIDIHPGAKIGEHFFIDHGTGVVVGETCEIGDWVKLYQGVTLGALSFQRDGKGDLVRNTKRHPTLEDNVVVYANATILGGSVVIGQGSVIGSSVWITESVAPNSTVVIESPKLVTRTRR